VALWVLQYIFRAPEEPPARPQQPQQNRPRPVVGPRPQPQPPPRPRRQVTDLDRFLEETRKRKQAEEGSPILLEVAPDQPPRDRAEAVERERKRAAARPTPPRPAPERRPPRPQPVSPPPRRPVSPPPEAPRPVVMEVIPLPEPAAEQPRQPTSRAEYQQPGAVQFKVPPKTEARGEVPRPVLADLARMLRTRQGLVAAVVLREILAPPLSQRGPGR
jgi:hypothetical protein